MTLADEIDAAIAALADLSVAPLRSVRRTFSKKLKREPGREVVSTALSLRSRGGLSRHFVACELVRHHPAAHGSLTARDLESFGTGLDSWAAVDTFATYLSGPAWREGQVPDSWIHGWARSTDRWRRRAALVSTVPLNSRTHGGLGDATRTLRICSLLAADRDDMVVKALSWALRELAKRDPAAVRGFLKKSKLAPRVVREVGNKLRTGKKNP
ncbi:MAG TPA: DNA alkylation repair protein [Planctomycetota bacterium]|nr:DNA alkylation repair protein [Planctomycetota bacterium]